MILSAQTIERLCLNWGMISPFSERTQHEGVSHGLSMAGYDVRVEFDSDGLVPYKYLMQGQFLLASTIERFRMPSNILGIVHDKSSWARLGLTVQNTVIEPNWEGWLTLELANHGPKPIFIKRGVGIAQVIFHVLDEPTNLQYDGKYQNQRRGPVKSLME